MKRLTDRPCSRLDADGFTMVVLLVVMAIMAMGMSALLPTWRQQAIREQEEELIFRGNQYARALALYSRKNNNLLPSDIEVLHTGKYLRKKYKDPITGGDFGLLPAGQPTGAAGRGAPGAGGTGRTGGAAPQTGRGAPTGTQILGSIGGVYSKSTNTSIRVYLSQQRYIDWPFTVQNALLLMGRAGGAGQPGQPGGGRDGRGGPVGSGGGPGDPRGGPVGGPRGGGPGRGIEVPPGRGGLPAPVPGRGRGGL
ncbi:MAG: type II secretion system protein [Acidobacteria bacterium]|nr:type II secretion system protein [Acidobacteriota bacterium]